MKKNNIIIIIGSIICVVLLFFMLIYRSSGGKSYVGDSQISIRVESGITLPKVYLDSLLTLVDLYQNDGVEFTQSTVSVFSSAVDSQSIECPISGMNQFRSKFSGGFYTFTARQEDIRTMQLNQAQVFEKALTNCAWFNCTSRGYTHHAVKPGTVCKCLLENLSIARPECQSLGAL